LDKGALASQRIEENDLMTERTELVDGLASPKIKDNESFTHYSRQDAPLNQCESKPVEEIEAPVEVILPAS